MKLRNTLLLALCVGLDLIASTTHAGGLQARRDFYQFELPPVAAGK